MLTDAERKAFYRLSTTLGVETYLLGCGSSRFLPKQKGSVGSVSTAYGDLGMTEWTVHCAENPDQRPWWMHTHPGFAPFFSQTDVLGAHTLFENIGREFDAFVLGNKDAFYQEVINEAWIVTHKKPEVQKGYSSYAWHYPERGYRGQGLIGYEDFESYPYNQRVWTPNGGIEYEQTLLTELADVHKAPEWRQKTILRETVEMLVASFGTDNVLDALVSASKKRRRDVKRDQRTAARAALKAMQPGRAIVKATTTEEVCPVCHAQMVTPYSCGRCDFSIGTG